MKDIFIKQNESIKDALKKLDKTAEKTLLVVDENGHLLGTITDGDIRRYILKTGSLEGIIDKIYNKNPIILYEYELNDKEKIKSLLIKNKIELLPVINEKKEIKIYLTWGEVFSEEERIVSKKVKSLNLPVVIMAGGKGTRLDPFTRILPKPLIPIGEKTILEIIIDKFVDYGINKFFLSVNYKAKIIKSYFEELNPNYKLEYLYEDKPLGTVGSIKQLEGKIKGDIFLTNCDIIINVDLCDLYEHHIQYNNDITIVASVKHYSIPYGICEIENGGTLIEIREKPEYDFLVNTGMYVMNEKVLKHIPENQFFHMTNLIEKVKSNGLRVGVYPISENSWVDTGEWIEYKKVFEKLKL